MAQLMFDDLPKGGAAAVGPLKFDDLPAGDASSQPEAPLTAGGLAKAGAEGVASGLMHLPGDVTALINLGRRGYNALTGGNYDPSKDDYSLGPTYDKAVQTVDNLYTPKNTAEGWAKTAGEWLPAVATGPEDVLGKGALSAARVLAGRVAKQAVLPYAAAKAADAAAQGTPMEPYAGPVAGMLAGGLLSGKAKPNVATADNAAVLAKGYGDAFRASPVAVKADVAEAKAKDIQNAMRAAGVYDSPAEKLLSPYIGNSDDDAVSLARLQDTRSSLAGERSAPGVNGTAGTIGTKMIDQWMSGLQKPDIAVAPDQLNDALSNLQNMRAAHAVRKQMELIEDKGLRANTRTLSTYSADNGDNALRQHMAALYNKQDPRLANYSPDILNLIKGAPLVNNMRRFGNMGAGLGSFLVPLGFMDAGLTGGLGSLAAVGGGVLLKRLAAKRTLGTYDALLNKVASKAPGYTPPVVPSGVLRKLSGAARGAYMSQQP